MSIEIDESQADLVKRVVLSVTIPILHEIEHSAAVMATGTGTGNALPRSRRLVAQLKYRRLALQSGYSEQRAPTI